jgi:hypothetical protein
MGTYFGWVAERQLYLGEPSALISCPPQGVPVAGQYILAVDKQSILSTPLFQAGDWNQGFLASPPLPDSWRPGTTLTLYGPLGRGFLLPADVQRLALIALGDTNARLLPLATSYLHNNVSVALFSDAPVPNLPHSMEAYPLDDLPESASWADCMAFDVPLESLERLAGLVDSFPEPATSRSQVLIKASMPCGSLGDCGACAVKVGRSWKFSCRDGPVFRLEAIVKGIGS